MKWIQWILLTAVTGNPILSLAIVLVAWWLVDRFTLGILPNPFRFLRRWTRAAQLRRTLALNPSDRRARLELAMLLVERRAYKSAIEVLKPNLEAGDEDATTLFVMGVACLGNGHVEQGELLLDEAESRDAYFRMGDIHLERGRWRLRRGDAPGALAPLRKLCEMRPGTVEGKVLLAQAHERNGDAESARMARQNAWNDYAAAPRYQQRRDRWWGWRAKPSRPLTYAAIALACGIFMTQFVAPAVQQAVNASPSTTSMSHW